MAAGTNRWKLGLFVVTGAALAFGAALWLGTGQLRRETIHATAFFDESVQGLEIGAPVKFRGVKLGAVRTISVAPDRRHVEVGMELYVDLIRKAGLYRQGESGPRGDAFRDFRLQIASSGITGVKFMLGDFFDPERYPPEILPFDLPDDFVPSVPSTIKSLEEAAVEALGEAPEVMSRLSALLARLDRTVVEVDAPAIAARVRRTLDAAEAQIDAVDAPGLVSRTAATLDEAQLALASARRLADGLDSQIGAVRDDLAKIESLARTIESAVKEADAGGTSAAVRGALGRITAIADDLRESLAGVREAARSLERLTNALERDPSALLYGKIPERPPGGSKP
jgi:paraquat-inducible protein B